MKEFKHDDERLAALLGGRLDGPEREELMAHLLADDEDRQVFADTAAILQEAEAEDAAQALQAGERAVHAPVRKAAPPSTRSGWRGTPRRLVIFTALVGLVASVTLLSRGRAGPGETPLQVADRLALAELPPGRAEQTFGEPVRGGAGSERVLTPSESAQAGVLLVDLVVAVEARNEASMRQLVATLKRDYDPSASNLWDSIAAGAGGAPNTLEPLLQRATERLEALGDRERLRLGAWTEAAVLAAQGRNAAFFDDPATNRMLRRAGQLKEAPAAREAAESARAALRGESPNWAVVEAELTALRNAITR